MKRLLSIICCVTALCATASARDGYRISVKFTDMKDTMVYLAHYYGKPLPTIYKADSARFDKNGVAVLQSKEKTLGGIYIMLLSDKKTYFEFLLNNGDEMEITATAAGLPDAIVFKNSPENEGFLGYERFLKGFGAKQQSLQSKMTAAKSHADSEAVRKEMIASGKDLIDFRHNYVSKHPGTLLSTIFNALEVPQVPEGVHKFANGTVDSTFPYTYYKAHYWDKFDFQDDRLIHTPIYDAKLDEYMNKLVLPYTDSVKKEADWLLAKTRGTKDMFKYTLFYLTKNVENSKIMGMDEVFVYLVENYYMKGDATWLTSEELQKYEKRARDIAPNVIGNLAPDIKMQDIDGKEIPLSSVKSKYTLVVFWDPTCGHCATEIPLLDSVYNAQLKKKGVKVYSVRTEGPVDKWQEFIKKHGLTDWVNVYDPEHHSDYRSKYDVYSTPVIYLLDEKKIIRGKRIDHTNIMQLIEMLEKKEKTASKQ